MLTLEELKKDFPYGGNFATRDNSSYAVKWPWKKERETFLTQNCYWRITYSPTGNQGEYGYHPRLKIWLLPGIPRRTSNERLLKGRVWGNMLSAFKDHGFFPKESEISFNSEYGGYQVYLPPNVHTINCVRLAAFTYRYIDIRFPMYMLAAYRQWLHLRDRGVTLWQCFYWAMMIHCPPSGHGIYTFQQSIDQNDPRVLAAFAYWGQADLDTRKKLGQGTLVHTLNQIKRCISAAPLKANAEFILSPEFGQVLNSSPTTGQLKGFLQNDSRVREANSTERYKHLY